MTVKAAASSLIKRPSYLVVTAVLLTAAIGLNGATGALKLHFKKEPVTLRRELKDLPQTMGHWRQVSIDKPLSHDMEEVLQTKNYLFRDYLDTRLVSAERLAQYEGKDFNERQQLLAAEPSAAIVRLSVTYYTGMVDTVSHIPDRCFVADGFQPTAYDQERWALPGFPVDSEGWRLTGDGTRVSRPGDHAGHEAQGLPVRFINFEDQDNRRHSVPRNVAYFFNCNGAFDSQPDGVRVRLQDLFERRGYYAKIELLTTLDERGKSKDVMRDFLADVLPEVEVCLPDWAAVASGATPAASAVTTSADVPPAAPPAASPPAGAGSPGAGPRH